MLHCLVACLHLEPHARETRWRRKRPALTRPPCSPLQRIPGRRANKSLLCLAVKGGEVLLYKIKVENELEDLRDYDLRQSWSLSQVKQVDGISTQPGSKMFAFELERAVRFQAEDASERDEFLLTMKLLCDRYLESSPTFVNIVFKEATAGPDGECCCKLGR